MARFYSNENIPLQVVIGLRLLGHDVLTSQDAGNANLSLPDEEVLAFAVAEDRIVLTLNRRHFFQLHRDKTRNHAGIVACTVDSDFQAQARRIDAAVRAEPEMTNKLIRVNRNG